MSFNPKNASGRKSAKPSVPTEKTIPRADPYPPVLPDGDGFAIPTQPSEKFLTKKGDNQIKIFSPVKHEVEKRSAMAMPHSPTPNTNELDALRREIERLRAEIAALQNERAVINNNYEEGRRNHDVALIRLMIEVDRLNGHLVEKNHEIDMLRANQSNIQNTAVNDLQIRSYLAKIEEYENRLRMLEPELQQWRYKCGQLEKDAEMRRASLEEEFRRRLEIEITHLRMNEQGTNEARFNQLLRDKQELESRFVVMTAELDKLNGLNRHYQEESEIMRRRIDELTLELNRSKQNPDLQGQVILLSAEIERLNGILNDKHREADHLRTRVIETENHHARQIEQVKQSHMIDAGQMEKQRVEIQEQMKLRYESQMKELTQRFSNERTALEAEIRQLRNRITELDNQLSRTNIEAISIELNAKFMQERSNYEAHIRELMAKIQELESKIALIAVEAERMHAAAEMRAREVESWREKYTRLETSRLEEVQMIISQNANLSKRVSISNDETEKIMRLFKELESEHSVLGSKYQQIARELEEMRRVRTSYVVEESYVPSVQDIRVRIQSINTEKNEYRDSTYPQQLNNSSTNVRQSYY